MKLSAIKRETLIIGTLITLFLASILMSVFQQVHFKNLLTEDSTILNGTSGIGLIQIYGPISVSNTSTVFGGGGGSDNWVEQIKTLKEDKRVKAIVLRINSPGGTVGASQEIYQELIKLKRETKTPIIVSIADVGASGGFWVAMAGDTIFANPGSMVGNIGVIMNSMNFSELAHKLGLEMTTYKSVTFKDTGSGWRKPTAEENRLLQDLVKNVHEQFVTVVQTSRKLTPEKARALADGRIYTGEQAQKAGLIDQLGTYEDALAFAQKKAGLKGKPNLISKNKNNIQELLNLWKSEASSYFKSIAFGQFDLLH
ncbi:MAG: signal peptide peptidase SppA [Candidatus Margulisbacteria bacterium]|nr:signal peptide peptidase SppA [Candidatus Margulisiibacteriota bacterium]